MFNFVAAVGKEYIGPVAAMFHSLALFNKDITLHLLHTDLGFDELQRIENAGKPFGALFRNYRIDPSLIRDLPVSGHLTVMTYARYFAPDILDVNIGRLVYLDADTIVTGSLRELFEMDLGNSVVAAGAELEPTASRAKILLGMPTLTPYRNSGVLVIDTKEWRKRKFAKSIVNYAVQNQSKLLAADQCAFNATMHGITSDLSARFNVIPTPKYGMSIEDPAIIHFVGSPKPWDKNGTWSAFHEWHSQGATGIPMSDRVMPKLPGLFGFQNFHELRRSILGIAGFRYHRRRLNRIRKLNFISARLLVEAKNKEMELTQF